jgi:hypothetical protein
MGCRRIGHGRHSPTRQASAAVAAGVGAPAFGASSADEPSAASRRAAVSTVPLLPSRPVCLRPLQR